MRLQVRLAAKPQSPYALLDATDGAVIARMPIEVGKAGVYKVKTLHGRPPALEPRTENMTMPNDVVLLTIDEPEKFRMVKYWFAAQDDFVGLSLSD